MTYVVYAILDYIARVYFVFLHSPLPPSLIQYSGSGGRDRGSDDMDHLMDIRQHYQTQDSKH